MLEEPTDCRLVELRDKDGSSCPMALVVNSRGTKHLVFREVWTKLLKESGSRRNLLRRVRCSYDRGRHDPMKACGLLLKHRLVQMGAIQASSCPPTLVTLAGFMKAAKTMHFPSSLVAALDAEHSNAGVPLQAATAAALHLNAGGQDDPGPLPMSESFPTIFGMQGQAVELQDGQRYGLKSKSPALAKSAMVSMQLESLRAWCCSAAMNMIRVGGQLKHATFEKVHEHCMLFLGYVHIFYGVAFPNLHHFANADLVAKYISSRVRRGDVSLQSWVQSARKVVSWLYDRAETAQRTYLTKMLTWLSQLTGFVRQACPPKKKGLGNRAVLIQEAVTLLHVLSQKKAEVEALFGTRSWLTLGQAWHLHDVALACTLFGWLPPQRGQVLMTLLPSCHEGPCPSPDCRQGACGGNRLRCSADPTRLRLEVPHHKTDKTWGMLDFLLPSDVSALLILYLSKGYQVLRHHMKVSHPFMFMNRDGRQLKSDGTFTTYWHALLKRWNLPKGGPHALRHAFVCLHMQSVTPTQVAGDQAGFAYCMGHSYLEWLRTYDLLFLQRAGQQAMDAMPAWRQAILASHAPTVQPAMHDAALHAEDDLPPSDSELVGSGEDESSVSGEDELELELSDDIP